MTIVVGFIALCICLALLKYIFKAAVFVLAVIFVILFGPAFLVGFIVERLSKLTRTSLLFMGLSVVGIGCFVGDIYFHGGINLFHAEGFSFYRNIVTVILSVVACYAIGKSISLRSINSNIDLLNRRNQRDLVIYHGSVTLSLISIFSPVFVDYFPIFASYDGWIGWIYWGLSFMAQGYLLMDVFGRIAFCNKAHDELIEHTWMNQYRHCSALSKENNQEDDDVRELYEGCIVHLVDEGVIREYELAGKLFAFSVEWDDANREKLRNLLCANLQWDLPYVIGMISELYELDESEAEEFLERYSQLGVVYGVCEDKFFVSYHNVDKFRVCSCCGAAEEAANDFLGEWFCSEICEKTEQICLEIKRKEHNDFISSAAASGFVLMAGGASLDKHYKMYSSVNNKRHGHAAEYANHKLDRLAMRDAELVGGDNAKNGADRVVNGLKIQSKYCQTAARSVGEAFEGKDGSYRYIDSSGKPMLLEVPKDQYEAAIKHMEDRIRRGKVPGVSNPDAAKDMVIRGHITYEQAKNITKFGTIESLSYDISEGAVVGLVAGGISFAVSASIYYLSTGDIKKALKTSAIQAGSVFGKTLLVHVGTQQLNRVAAVQKALNYIDVGGLSRSKIALLKKGFNVSSTNGVNKALRGTVVTSIVLIAVTTGPDVLKLARGRISKAQFIKNLTVASSGVAGGAIGSLAGGILLSPIPILGPIAGGIIGGMAASVLANKVASKFMVEDRDVILKLIRGQIECLAVTFLMTENELKNLNQNLERVLTVSVLEIIYAAGDHRRAMANLYLKPLVVSIVKQRRELAFSSEDIISACEEMAA